MLSFSIVSWLRGLAKPAPENGSCEGSAAQDVNKICTAPARESVGALFEIETPKICTSLRARAIWKSKPLKHRGFGTLLEVELRKICTAPARESDLEVKTVKAPGARGVFGDSKRFSRGRRRDFDTLQNTRQAQEFVRVA